MHGVNSLKMSLDCLYSVINMHYVQLNVMIIIELEMIWKEAIVD